MTEPMFSLTWLDLSEMCTPSTTLRAWRLNARTLELVHKKRHYPVDLERCDTSAAMLDIIMQVARKTWADDETVAELVQAFRVLLNPQATLCSFGQSETLDDPAAQIRSHIRKVHHDDEAP